MTGSIVYSRFLVALKATGTSVLKVAAILVARKATVDRNVNSHCGQGFGSSEKLRCQLRYLTGSIVSSRFLVALKAAETSDLKVVAILAALKAPVDRNANSYCLQNSGSSKSYGYRVKKVATRWEREILNVTDPNLSQCGGPTCEEDSLCGRPTSDENVSCK